MQVFLVPDSTASLVRAPYPLDVPAITLHPCQDHQGATHQHHHPRLSRSLSSAIASAHSSYYSSNKSRSDRSSATRDPKARHFLRSPRPSFLIPTKTLLVAGGDINGNMAMQVTQGGYFNVNMLAFNF